MQKPHKIEVERETNKNLLKINECEKKNLKFNDNFWLHFASSSMHTKNSFFVGISLQKKCFLFVCYFVFCHKLKSVNRQTSNKSIGTRTICYTFFFDFVFPLFVWNLHAFISNVISSKFQCYEIVKNRNKNLCSVYMRNKFLSLFKISGRLFCSYFSFTFSFVLFWR